MQNMENKKLRIVFFGTPEFAVESLDAIIKAGHDVAAVVTMPDKVAGRGHKIIQSDVKKYAVGHELPLLQPEKLRDPEFLDELRSIKADIFVIIAFRMLPEAVWAMPPMGTFNLHASLLPRYRGAAPINRAIMNGDTETGVTLFFLNHDIDTGNIIDYATTEILPEDNAGTLHDRLMHLGAVKVVETLQKIADGTATSMPQPEGEFIAAPKIFRDTCLIDWSKPSEDVHNLIRGLSPYPAAFTYMKDKNDNDVTVKIYASRIDTDNVTAHLSPGKISVEGKRMFVDTASGRLEILTLMPAGKKKISAEEFVRGYSPEYFYADGH